MKTLTRLQKLAIVMGILLIGTYVVAPIVGAKNPGGDLGKIIGKVINKGIAHGEITKAHQVMEKAFQKFKEHPAESGLALIGAVTTTKEGISMVVEALDKYGFNTAYDVRLEHNDDDQCMNIYVEGERMGGVVAYKTIANLNEDEVNTKIKDATDNAILEYQIRHKSDT